MNKLCIHCPTSIRFVGNLTRYHPPVLLAGSGGIVPAVGPLVIESPKKAVQNFKRGKSWTEAGNTMKRYKKETSGESSVR